jgi:hypothetical protein
MAVDSGRSSKFLFAVAVEAVAAAAAVRPIKFLLLVLTSDFRAVDVDCTWIAQVPEPALLSLSTYTRFLRIDFVNFSESHAIILAFVMPFNFRFSVAAVQRDLFSSTATIFLANSAGPGHL